MNHISSSNPDSRPRRQAFGPIILLVIVLAVLVGACQGAGSDPSTPAFPRWLTPPPDGTTPELAEFEATEEQIYGIAFHASSDSVDAVVAHYQERLDPKKWKVNLGRFDGPNGVGIIVTAKHRKKARGFHLTVSPVAEGSELIYNFTEKL